jgi:hypothetical protein
MEIKQEIQLTVPAKYIAGHKTRADTLITALELRLLAKRIIPITAVSPAPIFERKENG